MTADRRSSPRLPVDLPGVLLIGGPPLARMDGTVVEVSRGGCRMLLGAEVPEEASGGILAVLRSGQVSARPVRRVLPAEGGVVRVIFEAAAVEGDDWDPLLSSLNDDGGGP
jgi:hypothetical protein